MWIQSPVRANTWVVGLIPGQGMYEKQPTNVSCIDISLSVSLSPFLSAFLSLKTMKTCPPVRIKKKKKRKKTYLKTRKFILHIEIKIGVQYKNNSSKQKRTFNFFKCYFLQNELCLNTFAFTVLDKECRQTNRKCRHQDFC